MPKPKLIQESGQVLAVEPKEEQEIVEVSYTQAKKMVKKPMSESQKAHVQKMVEMNRIKWEAQRQAKEAHYKKLQEEEEARQKVIVKPKRIYPPVSSADKRLSKKQPEVIVESSEEEESEEESEEEPIQASRSRSEHTVSAKKVESKRQILKKIEEVEQKVIEQKPPQSKYGSMMSKFWGFQ